MSLESEIEAGRKTVQTDDTIMTFGELANLYRDQDLIISPEFQRTFRWPNPQNTKKKREPPGPPDRGNSLFLV